MMWRYTSAALTRAIAQTTRMGNTSRRRATSDASPLSANNERITTVETKREMKEPLSASARGSFEVADGTSPPDMVAVTLRCSQNLGNIREEHLQKLLKNLHNDMKSFQWTLCAEYPDSSFAAATTTPGKMCFCSTYPLGSWVVWPSGVTEQTNTVLIDLWIQKTSLNTSPHQIMRYTSDSVGLWIDSSLNNSERIWVMCRYVVQATNGTIEKVVGHGYQNGKYIS